ncbi:MAG: hypothetical protein U1G07_12630 [Verrucomicrobiota bacterium]
MEILHVIMGVSGACAAICMSLDGTLKDVGKAVPLLWACAKKLRRRPLFRGYAQPSVRIR